MAAAQNVKTINPYEYCFRQLSCNVRPLPSHSDTYQLLMRYINSGLANSNGNQARKYNLQNIYEVNDANRATTASSAQLFDDLH